MIPRSMKYFLIILIGFDVMTGVWAAETVNLDDLLRYARRDFLLAEQTYKRVEAELPELSRANNQTTDVRADYHVYLDQIGKMVEIHRLRVRRLETELARTAPKETSEPTSEYRPVIEDTTSDTDKLDRELTNSLGAFDEFIMQELSLIDERRSRQLEEQELNGLAAQATAAVQRLAQSGIDLDPPDDALETETQHHG